MTRGRTRRRGQELEQAILDAVWAELDEVGYTGLTIEGVAARAGTSKPVIYRRWSNRAALVLAAWTSRQPSTNEPIDTGALRSDLLALFTRIAQRTDQIMNEMIAGVMGEAFRDPAVVALLQERLRSTPLAEAITRMVHRAAERGELPDVPLPGRAARLPLDLIRSEAILQRAALTEQTVVELVDEIYLPLLRGLAVSPPEAAAPAV
ncbi:MAG TPA: TetR/AcrR family transcriptional regulator [Actinophytocola sp.]|uniref:TetR/AcrR family transcriptional regulator n=1 Tax=Actinophytocola sp. TaxID=1872138 RepID=UPI002DB62BF0|nr:TetR/AcrR family transcriptional regulator [Actinophytocola sp.]HEU5470702.1 TetR/AcrR family transcriptional regulator [Actinophytocola sp.]